MARTVNEKKKKNNAARIKNKIEGERKGESVTWVEKRSGKFFLKRCQGLKVEDLDI